MKEIFIITVDVEGLPLKNGSVDYSTIIDGVPLLLDLFDEFSVQSTFFITGDVAEKTTDLLRKVIQRGNEIGCHGNTRQGLSQQYIDIKEATNKIRDRLKVTPIGFRNHLFRMNDKTLGMLIKLGYRYDSSIVPSSRILNKNYFPTAPKIPYHPSLSNISKKGGLPIVEIPISVLPIVKLPLGLSYMKFFGLDFFKLFLSFVNQRIITLYLHPYDILSWSGQVDVPLYFRLTQKKGSGFIILRELLEYLEKSFCPIFVCAKEALGHAKLIASEC